MALVATLSLLAGAAQAADGPSKAVLHLTNGGVVSGELKNSAAPARLGWQSPLFATPFEFEVNAVSSVNFPLPARLPKPVGEYCVELAHGDVLFGGIAKWEGNHVELDMPRAGRVVIREADIHRLYRWRNSSDLVYQGPNGLADWQASTAGKGWREEFGHLTTDQDGANLRADLELPAQAVIEFEISWKKKPDFLLALGAGENDSTLKEAWRFEVWDGDLVFQRELDEEEDLAAIQKIVAGPGRAHLFAYLDQERSRCLVFSSTGEQLADLKLEGGRSRRLNGVRLENKHGDLRLERLRIARWAGRLPREFQSDKPRIHRVDGSVMYGKPAGYDTEAKEFLVRGPDGESKLAADAIESIVLSLPDDARPRPIRALYQDGTQLSGELLKVADGALWLSSPSIKDPLRMPIEGMRSLIVARHEAPAPADVGPIGMLELDGLRLRGRLIEGEEARDATCLVWQPLGSDLGSALLKGHSGRIVYREPPPPRQMAQVQANATGKVVRVAVAANGAVIRQAVPAPAGAVPGAAAAPGIGMPPQAAKAARVAAAGGAAPEADKGLPVSGQRTLHLRSGDTIACEVQGIDETGVLIKTPISDATFVAHEKVKAIELTSETSNAARLNKVKRDRLLMLPRMQRDNPPTHLIHSRNGDFLRGRVIGMNDKVLRIEARLETKEIPRDRIAQIIWLHPDELDENPAPGLDGAKRDKEKSRQEPGVAEPKIAQWLASRPTTVEFLDLPLEDALTFLKEYHNFRLSIDREKIAAQGIAIDHPVTLKMAGVPFVKVLKELLDPLKLTYEIEPDGLLITTAADSAADSPPRKRLPFPAPIIEAGQTRVQALRSDGSRLTFFASQMTDATLAGTSDVLGACRVNLKQIDQLLFGTAIEQAAAQLAYQQWKLHNAPDPKFVLADGADGDVDTGTDSVLVGKPAPDFELQLLTGKKFQLAQNRGRVVVLDFWATWCGPCLTAMPLVDRIVREFDGAGVQLLAVNQQETPKQINSMLERHKLDLTVALDRDGAVSQKYRAESIPQTVIIDRAGNVARVFVGIGPNSAETLREALRSVLAPPGDPAKPSP